MSPPTDLWVVGDIHGEHAKLRALLRGAGLLGAGGGWTGGEAHLAFLGDYLDRGPDGLGVVRLIRELEEEAPHAGGRVTALLGNHEVMFLAAEHFRRADPEDRFGFQGYWVANGGQASDAARAEPGDLAWLAARPALARVGGWLLLHADSPMYLHLGASVEAVNARVAALLGSEAPEVWGHFANAFAGRLAFAGAGGERAARKLLGTFGGERLAHGHTPVYVLLDEDVPGAGSPFLYAGDLCVALDSGMAYREEAGFIVRLEGRGVAEVVTLSPGEASG